MARLGGAILKSDDDIYGKIWSAFDLPQYFGWNWCAFNAG
ncbi:barstar family protein [Mangrovactinospora gilvigrisea]